MKALPVVAVFVAMAGLLAAQQPQTQQPIFRTGTNQVRVDVTVVNHKGDPVVDLKKDDFEVREDGVLQTIDSLKLVEATGQAPGGDMALEIRSPEHAAAEAAKDDVRVFVIFWDEYHIGQFQPAMRAREALTDFVQTAFGPTDLVAVTDQLTPTDAIRFTRNRRELADQVHQLKGRQGVYVPARSAMEEAQMERGQDVEMLRAQVTASAIDATVSFLGTIKEGRKSLLLVSQTIGPLGGGFSQQDTMSWLDGAVRNANANNTTIYTLDPRGLNMNMRTSDVLHALASNTGGRQFSNNYPASALKEIVRNASAFYLLGYASAKNPADGKFHKISVKVKRSGVDVTARNGYYAPSLAEMDAAKKKASEDAAPPEIAKALAPLVEAPHLPAEGDLWAGASPGADGTPRITAVWAPRAASSSAHGIWLRASGDDGHICFDGPVQDRVAFDAPAGTLHLRQQQIEADGSKRTDQAESTLDVPDFKGTPLAISTPVLLHAATPLQLRTLLANPDPLPYPGRQFERTDRVLIRFVLTGAPDATVAVHLLSSKGKPLADLPVKSAAGGYEIDLPVTSIARGEYLVEIDASHGADHAKQLVPFKVN
jgi:VWFA-related protein